MKTLKRSESIYKIDILNYSEYSQGFFEGNIVKILWGFTENYDEETGEESTTYYDIYGKSDGNFGGSITLNTNLFGEKYNEGANKVFSENDLVEIYSFTLLEEFTHAAHYDFYTKKSNSNAEQDLPGKGNNEFETKVAVGYMMAQMGLNVPYSSVNSIPFSYGTQLYKGESSISDYFNVMDNWKNSKEFNNSVYKSNSFDNSSPEFLNSLIKQ